MGVLAKLWYGYNGQIKGRPKFASASIKLFVAESILLVIKMRSYAIDSR